MRISRICIQNFRNFKNLDISVGESAVVVGENKIGKSNLLAALRLVLDPSLPDSARQLRSEDFWDGLDRPLRIEDRIRVDVEFTDYENNTALIALLADALVDARTHTSRLSYVFEPIPSLGKAPQRQADYQYSLFIAGRSECPMDYGLRSRIPMDLLPALRDADGALANWRTSPLRPLLEYVSARVDRDAITSLAQELETVSNSIVQMPEMRDLSTAIEARLARIVGDSHAVDMELGVSPTDPERLIRSLRLFIDGRKRGLGDASLGTANLIYLTLKQLELEQMVTEHAREHTIFCIEEPEAHLHPHLQRLVYREYLETRDSRHRATPVDETNGTTRGTAESTATRREVADAGVTKIMTTHSPHIVSVAPVKSLVLLKRSRQDGSTVGSTTARLDLTDAETSDLERYLDVTRGELVFGRAVMLVEGESETYIVPALARLLGHDFDELGISVCSVGGINFDPYVKLIGPHGLDLPYAVLTDRDPADDGREPGRDRLRRIFPLTWQIGNAVLDCPANEHGDFLSTMRAQGLFLSEHTLEVDLFKCGQHEAIAKTLHELSGNGACRARATAWARDPISLDVSKLLSDVKAIGKGRFAQRLAANLRPGHTPDYIATAINFVVERSAGAPSRPILVS